VSSCFWRTQLVFEVRGLETEKYPNTGSGSDDVMHFEKGTVANNKFYPQGGGAAEDLPPVEVKLDRKRTFREFHRSGTQRKISDLNANPGGHYSSALCQWPISLSHGQGFSFDVKPEAFTGNEAALEALERMKAHLRKTASISKRSLSNRCHLDDRSQTERFVDDPIASALATRTYRKPFVVPEKV
jgi:hypothetical protein